MASLYSFFLAVCLSFATGPLGVCYTQKILFDSGFVVWGDFMLCSPFRLLAKASGYLEPLPVPPPPPVSITHNDQITLACKLSIL